MPTAVQICNIALQNIGANQIGALSDSTPEAEACNLRYDAVRRAVLESNLWTFAVSRASLNELTATPLFGYQHQFALPSDYIRMAATEEQEQYLVYPSTFNGYITISNVAAYTQADDYKIERVKIGSTYYNALLCNNGSKKIVYIYDNDDEGTYQPLFTEMLAQALAASICYRVTGNQSKADKEAAKFQDMLENTSAKDSQTGTSKVKLNSTLVGVRL